MRNFFIYTLFSGLLMQPATAQEVVLDQPDTTTYIGNDFGPNRKHHFISKFSFGINAPLDLIPDMRYSPFRSWNIQVGSIYKYKLSQHVALLGEFSLSSENMVFRQDADIPFSPYPSVMEEITTLHWSRTSLDLQFGIRFNYQKNRGNHLGNYIDIGVIGGVPLYTRWEYHGEDANNTNVEVILRKPENVALSAGVMPTDLAYYYGAYTRIGFNKLAITVRGVQYTQNRWILLPGVEFDF